MFYNVTAKQIEAYNNEDDGLEAIKILGIEVNRFTSNGLKRDNGSIEAYEDFHQRIYRLFTDGNLSFEL